VPINHVLIRDNTMIGSFNGVRLEGEVHKVLVVGNRIKKSQTGAIELTHLLPGTEDILAANNTMYMCDAAVTIWDDHAKGKDFLKCKNIRVHNNLVFETVFPGDFSFSNQRRDVKDLQSISPGDLGALLRSPEWHFSHNWREVDPIRAKVRIADRFIPFSPTDQQMPPNPVLSYKPGDPDFLRPPKDSPLAWSGAGGHAIPSARIAAAVGQAASLANPWMAGWAVAQPMSLPDTSLPAYVGAVPPEGVEPWDWQKTWIALTR
jgi:hypothetical protein